MLKLMLPGIRLTLALTVLTGLVYPLMVTGLAQGLLPAQANGSLLRRNGRVVGSALIGQSFARPEYFHPRPSAAGSGYDGANSGGTNLGPTSSKLINGIHKTLPNGKDDPGNFDGVRDLAERYRLENRLGPAVPLPSDAVTRSASGLDPHITPENAELQVPRVASARRIPVATARALVARHTRGRDLGFLGEPRVNVLELNLDLDRSAPLPKRG
ncbi:MAG TPA: potassium-transporting ATPase subunit KdpC [Armatimonadota bacterium]|jgi:K+-transporting ATPase ATPase C chain